MAVMREVTWGEALGVAAGKYPGGLKAAVEALRYDMGGTVGVRSTFVKLTTVDDPALLGERDMYRAWILLATIGEDPREWGIPDSVLPRIWPPDHMRGYLRTILAPGAPGFEERLRERQAAVLREYEAAEASDTRRYLPVAA